MVICRIKLILAVILFLSCFLWADEELDEIYKNIQSRYAKIKTFEADFVQENEWKEVGKSQKSNGTVYFDKKKFLLKYDAPEGQLLLIAESGVTLYDSVSNQALISDSNNFELRPDKLIAEYWNNSIKEIKLKENDVLIVKLTTADGTEIYVGIKDYLISDLRVVDKNSNSVLYAFSNEKINKKFPKKIFELELPDDASIIDNRTE